MYRKLYILFAFVVLLFGGACSNNPFPKQDAEFKVRYIGFDTAPKTLDPAVAYNAGMGNYIRSGIYECLLEYHYTKRPYELIPGLSENIPEAVTNPDNSVSYHFKIRKGVFFHPDPCFTINGSTNTTRELSASDFEFELMRTADPDVLCPVISPLSNIRGLREFMNKLRTERSKNKAFAKLPITEQYKSIGPISGVTVNGKYDLTLTLSKPYPQIMYWLAMPFTAAIPWEAIVYYNGKNGHPKFRDHPVGTGPYYLKIYDKEFRAVLERNPLWYGLQHPEWKAPATIYPTNAPSEYAGKTLAFIERFEFRREKESVSRFSKFMQGYYDNSVILKENFDNIIVENELSPEMQKRNIRLEKTVALHIGYIGFNMNDPDIGSAAGEKGRKLRQAMSLAVDTKEFSRIFMNGRGIPAQSPIPPGIFGYDPDYVNPYRTHDLKLAHKLLAEAGYPNGIDPATGKPLKLNFDVMGTSSSALMVYKFYINAWRSIGLNVVLKATNYNQFQDKVRNDAYQIFTWGWGADYPDPENFLFLLYSEMARNKNNGPNSANFANKEFDRLFLQMRCRPNDETRYKLCRQMVKILENECPWIPLIHNEDYGLYHNWLKNINPAKISSAIFKYEDIIPSERYAYQQQYNKPIMWPLYLGLFLLAAIITPAVITYIRERQ